MNGKELFRGEFVREEKNRFLCTVIIDGVEQECYIPSSCRLNNFLQLAGKAVLLTKNANPKARTTYAVFAVGYGRNYITLNTSEANRIILKEIKKRRFHYLGKRINAQKEYTIDGYKSDVFLPDEKTIIEIKSIISTDKRAIFPSVYSERALNQLKKLRNLLSNGYKVVYLFISLNPYVDKISISSESEMKEYHLLFSECINAGLKCKGYSVEIVDGDTRIRKEIPCLEDDNSMNVQ